MRPTKHIPGIKFRADDIVIAFMGPTGSGKSHFIDLLLCEPGRRAGKSLKPTTTQISATRFLDHPVYKDRVVLVDTPSFDNDTMPDMAILQQIGDWMRQTYEQSVKLTGLLYLHSITHNRLAGAPKKNLRLLGELCGDDTMKRVILVSTMWQKVKRRDDAERREEELLMNFWKPLLDKGSRADRLERSDQEDAWAIVDRLVEESTEQEAILLQKELVDYEMRLVETQAGRVLSDDLRNLLVEQKNTLRQLLNQLEKLNDPTLVRVLKQEYEKTEGEFRNTLEQIKRYRIPLTKRLVMWLFGKRSTSGENKPNIPTSQSRLQSLISSIIENPTRRALISALKGDDAQCIADYFNLVLYEPGVLTNNKEKDIILSSLCKLAKSAGVYPRYVLLKGITRDADPTAGGGFADVYKGKHDKQMVCLKVIRIFQRQENVQLLRAHVKELALWPHLCHQNILPFYGAYLLDEPAQRVCLVSPWMENGNLHVYLKNHPKTSPMPLLLDTAYGLEYLHRSSVVHGDLKAENILVSDDGRALIADFGLAHVATASGLAPTKSPTGGTTRWAAPELLAFDSSVLPTLESDIWSFGCLCYEVLSRKLPFHQYNDQRVVIILSGGKEVPTRPLPGEDYGPIDDGMWDIMTRCWNYTPRNRPTCEAILESIKSLPFQDDRPQTLTQTWEKAAAFRKAVREKSGANMDYERVEEVLLRVQTSGCVTGEECQA